jgi:hypothetical protein
MATIDLDSVVARAAGFTTAPVQDELMMMSVEHGAYFSLDEIATEIWGMLEEPARVRDLTDRLQQRYAVPAEECQADVIAFLGEMHKNGMILVK